MKNISIFFMSLSLTLSVFGYTYKFINNTPERLEVHVKLLKCDQTLTGSVEGRGGTLELYAHGDIGGFISRKGCLIDHLWAQDSTGYAVADYGYPNMTGDHTFVIVSNDNPADRAYHKYKIVKK